MRAKGPGISIAVALTVVLLTLPGLADKKPTVHGKVNVEGVITAVDRLASAFLLRVTKHGSGTTLVLVQDATELVVTRHKTRGKERDEDDEDEGREEHARQQASITDVHVGDQVKVQGFPLDDGRLLALQIDIRNRVVPVHPPVPLPSLIAQGVVIAMSLTTITVLDASGPARVVQVAASTPVTGQRAWIGAIVPDDVVRVEGVLNRDGSVTARRIDVVFASGYQVTGRITQKSAMGGQFLVLDNRLAVNVAADTRIISGGQMRSFSDLQVGQVVTAAGTPVTVGPFTIGENAKVITF